MSELDGSHVPVAVVGGGQAGLSVSWWLTRLGIRHVVLERHRIGHAWREQRWDSFCLVTPNWQCQLPGFPYAGEDPDGFMVKDEIVDYIEAYAASFDPPVVEGVDVTSVSRLPDGSYDVVTSRGRLTASAVVVATGGYHVPVIPRLAERLPAHVVQVTVDRYRSPSQLPEGEVLVVGSGQSGAQISEDLHLTGRVVHLGVGNAPRCARFYRGRDVVAWLNDMGHYDIPVTEHPLGEAAAERTNHYVTGRDGGRDIDLRAFARDGMQLYGRLESLQGNELQFADDLTANLDSADATSEGIKDAIDRFIDDRGIDAPAEARRPPVWQPEPGARTLDVERLSAVVWCTGFRSDYSWLRAPVFGGRGRISHHRGVTPVEGLYVIGLPWLHTWGSGRFSSVARDAEHLAGQLRAQLLGRLVAAGAGPRP